MRDSFFLIFLYKTTLGRLLLKILVQPGLSRFAGKILSSGASKYLVPLYIKKHKISMDNIIIPPGGFSSFNDFFTRKRNKIFTDSKSEYLLSPCDGFLTPVKIRDDTALKIKHTWYSLEDLVKDEKLASEFKGGIALIFRLTPAHYHRYCYSADGKILSSAKIQGQLHCVRPVALSAFPVYIQNSREYQVIETEKFGLMLHMEVGALLVGKIKNHRAFLQKMNVQAGEEKGYFEFGGSTVILILKKDAIRINKKFKNKNNIEIPVRLGEGIAKVKNNLL